MNNGISRWQYWRPGELRWHNGVLQQRFHPYVDTGGLAVAIRDDRKPEWRDVPTVVDNSGNEGGSE